MSDDPILNSMIGQNPQGMYMPQQQPNYQQQSQHLSHYPQDNLQQGICAYFLPKNSIIFIFRQ